MRQAFLIFSIVFLPWSLLSQSGRIAIRMDTDGAEFYHTGTGLRFEPRGFNYIQLVQSPAGNYGESALFLPESHDLIAIDDDFQRMSALGYNVVRVFVDLCRGARCIADAGGLRPEYIANIKSLLQRARQYNLYVMLTANWLPDLGDYSGPAHAICESSGDFFGGNCLLLSPKGVELYSKFFTDLIQALQAAGAPMEQIWSYQLRNEFFVEHWNPPFNKSSGMVTAANGVSYDMSNAADKIRMGEDGVVFWANAARQAIRQVDPQALVTAGFFTPNAPNILREGDERIVPFRAAMERSELDFFDIHAYAGFHDFRLEAENYGIIGYMDKPVVLGEYGAFLPVAPSAYTAAQLADHWQSAACNFGVDGFIFWTWDRHRTNSSQPDDPWSGSEEQAFIGQVLSPYHKFESCDPVLPEINVARGKPTQASMEWEGFTSDQVVDGNATETPWIAGGNPPQWVEVDLEARFDLAAIQLVVETGSDDPFFYTHEIQVKGRPGASYQTLHTFAAERVNFEVITYQPDDGLIEDVRFVRILITQAPGWAALHELRALLPEQRAVFEVPPPPILTYPRPGLDELTEMELRWKNDQSAWTSEVQIALDTSFNELLTVASDLPSTHYDIGFLEVTDTLYWRVRQTNAFGTGFWSVTGVISTQSTQVLQPEPKVELFVYPNPASEKLFLHGRAPALKSVEFAFRDLAGRAHHSGVLNSNVLDVGGLPPGVYILELKEQSSFVRIKVLIH